MAKPFRDRSSIWDRQKGSSLSSAVLLHTIALEPARWTVRRTSQKLTQLLPVMAAAGFRQIEVFEPHLSAEGAQEITSVCKAEGIFLVVLSSYLDLSITLDEHEVVHELRKKIEVFEFRKIRLFPGLRISPRDDAKVTFFRERLFRIAEALSDMEILLETHDQSIADDPVVLNKLVHEYRGSNLGLLYQPTTFQPEAAWDQFELQKMNIRHVHLQDRNTEGDIVVPGEGVLPWKRILGAYSGDVSIEFLPAGMTSEETFSLPIALQEAERVRRLICSIRG